MGTFKFIINTPNGNIFNKDVKSVNFNSGVGFLTIFSNHSNITGVIKKSEVKVQTESIGFVENGIYRFYNNTLEFIVAHFSENDKNIDKKFVEFTNELKLSNIKKGATLDWLLEIELLKHLKKTK